MLSDDGTEQGPMRREENDHVIGGEAQRFFSSAVTHDERLGDEETAKTELVHAATL